MENGQSVHKLNEMDKATFYTPSEVWCSPSPSSTKPEDGEFDWSSNAHAEQERSVKLAELKTIPVSKTPTTVLTANGEVQIKEAQVYVHGLNLFVTLQILEDTPAVLSLGTLRRLRIFL